MNFLPWIAPRLAVYKGRLEGPRAIAMLRDEPLPLRRSNKTPFSGNRDMSRPNQIQGTCVRDARSNPQVGWVES
jgi:hypothetical protein